MSGFKNLYLQKKRTLARLIGIQKIPNYNNIDQLRILEKELHQDYLNIIKSEEEFWMLKSRITWLALGDRNTSFFHRTTLIRHRKNRITQLLREDGTWILNPSDIVLEINNYLINCHAYTLHVTPLILPTWF